MLKPLILISDKQIKLAQVSNNIPFPWFEYCFLFKFLTFLQLRALFLMYQLRIKPPLKVNINLRRRNTGKSLGKMTVHLVIEVNIGITYLEGNVAVNFLKCKCT